ncbi:MAG: hypothetical protein ACFCD0_25705 [Gemmataceae bacterium]
MRVNARSYDIYMVDEKPILEVAGGVIRPPARHLCYGRTQSGAEAVEAT